MLKIMYPYFEPVGGEFFPQLGRNPIASFGDKIKGGAKSKLYLQSPQANGTLPDPLCSPHRGSEQTQISCHLATLASLRVDARTLA